MRVVVRAPRGLRDADLAEQRRPPAPTPRAGRRDDAARTASAIWLPTVNTGLSAVIGSWKTIASPAPRTRAHLALGQREQVAAVEQDLPADDAPRRRHEPHERQRRHALAAARLADEPEDAPAPRARTTRRRRRAPRRRSARKHVLELAHLEQRHQPGVRRARRPRAAGRARRRRRREERRGRSSRSARPRRSASRTGAPRSGDADLERVREPVLVVAERDAQTRRRPGAPPRRAHDVERVAREPDASARRPRAAAVSRYSPLRRRRRAPGGPVGARAGGTPSRMSTTSATRERRAEEAREVLPASRRPRSASRSAGWIRPQARRARSRARAPGRTA